MESRLNRKIIAGAVAIAALAGGGAAIASTQLGGEAGEQAILQDAAKRLGVEPSELSEALEQAYLDRIDEAVAAGELTEEQAERLKERIEAGDVPLVGVPAFGLHRFHDGGPLFRGLEAAASYLGLDEAALREQLAGGKTLAEIAQEQGKSVEGLEQALLDAAEERLAAAVEDGRLTESQKDEMLERLSERIDELVRGELPEPPEPGFPGPRLHLPEPGSGAAA
jgi:hypothetical protein